MDNKIKIVILAGGKGTRMKQDIPKVLVPLRGKPMIKHLLESVEKSGICDRPCIVVGYGRDEVMKELGDKYDYAIQEEQLGTGHAVLCAKDYLQDAEHILVLYGDNPYMTPETMQKLISEHLKYQNKITMATVKLTDFEDWRSFFYTNFSRIIRDENGKILKSVEFRDASDEEKKVLEVNPCYFCFNSPWLIENLKTLKNNNNQKEYYLTDLVKAAIEEGEKIESINIDPSEALAVNSKDELDLLEKFNS
ncbi:MAG: NTP transferase domain-containing protein [bacterium]